MAIHQILTGASAGDAITNLACRYRTALSDHVESEIFALHVDHSAEHLVTRLPVYERVPRSGRDLLVVHASIGDPQTFEFLMRRPEPIVVVYHNVSPNEPYQRFAPDFAGLLASGRAEIRALQPRAVGAVADSAYNARELAEMGYRDVRVIPPALSAADLVSAEPSPSLRNHLRSFVDGPVVLFVGQLLPHKRIEELLLAYHVLITYLVPDANLFAVGSKHLIPYTASLEQLVRTLALQRVAMPGKVPAGDLAAFYERADVFVTLSDHEGFCVPLVEAMSLEVPVIAPDHAAIGETLGNGGILLPPEPSVTLAAEAIAQVLGDGALRSQLAARGRARLTSLAVGHPESEFVETVLRFAA